MRTQEKLTKQIELLIDEGQKVLNTSRAQPGNWMGTVPYWVDLQMFSKWHTSCKFLMSLIGDVAGPYRAFIDSEVANKTENAMKVQGVLESIKQANDNGLLLPIEDLIVADVFSDLLSQAEYLLSQNYHLAAGVLFRAVLEEKLRRMCDSNNCTLAKQRPTIADYNSQLYKEKIYDKITLKQVESIAAIGNEAAHNKGTLEKGDVVRFQSELNSFLSRWS